MPDIPEEPHPLPEWDRCYPPNCPDSNAVDTEGSLYRLVAGDDNDYKSYYELDRAPGASLCRRLGLSCKESLEEAWEDQRIVKGIYIGVTEIRLRPYYGKMKLTNQQTRHYELWLRTAYRIACASLFVPTSPP